MAVGFDAQSFTALAGTGGTWTHTPAGSPKGIVVGIVQGFATADQVSSVTFGGSSLTRVPTDGFWNQGTVPKLCAAYMYFLGTAVPASGTVNVVASALGGTMGAWAMTVTANQAWTEIAASQHSAGSAVQNPSATVASSSYDSGVAVGVLYTGLGTAVSGATADAGYTKLTGQPSFGTTSASAASGDMEWGVKSGANVSVGFDATSSREVLLAALIREVVPSQGTMPIVNSQMFGAW